MLTKNVIIRQLYSLGIGKNDVVLIRADLGKVGRIEGGAFGFVDALLDVVGEGGTIISLAFTSWGSFIKKPKIEDAFGCLNIAFGKAPA